MKKVLYLHGFASAGSSGTATQMRNHLYPMGVSVLSPDIPVSPLEAMRFLQETVEREAPALIVATSMGALYAEQLRGTARILVNPSFHMARLLTFGGMKRQEFQQVEKQSFQGITPEDRELVYGLFGTLDKRVNCQPEFRKHYGTAHFTLFEGEHFLNGQVLSHVVLPLVEEILVHSSNS